MSEKNNLQEYCQQNKISMPDYKSWSKGLPHQLEWWATVTIVLDGNKITLDSHTSSASKTSAEKQVAGLMLNLLKERKNICHSKPSKVSPKK